MQLSTLDHESKEKCLISSVRFPLVGYSSCLNSRANKTCFGKLRQIQKKGNKMPAKKVDEEFLQSCTFRVAEISQTQIDEMCNAAAQRFKQGYEDEIATLKAEIS